MSVFSHRLGRKAADRFQCGAPDYSAGAAEERCIPKVVAILQQTIEHISFGRYTRAGWQVPLKRARRIKMMGGFHKCYPRVARKPAHCHLKKRARRDVIAIEYRNEVAACQGHCVIEIAGLGVRIVGSNDIAAAAACREIAEREAAAV